jgi:hypothetical protein
MSISYRHNRPELPRPIKAPVEPDRFEPGDEAHFHPRTFGFRRSRFPILVTKAQFPVESPKRRDFPSSQESDMTTKKKATKKTVAKKANGNGAAKGPGVIATIVDCISKDKGSTADETLAVLTKAFPDRDPDGMRKTVIIQSNKQKTSKEAVEDRGLVYYKRR